VTASRLNLLGIRGLTAGQPAPGVKQQPPRGYPALHLRPRRSLTADTLQSEAAEKDCGTSHAATWHGRVDAANSCQRSEGGRRPSLPQRAG
jgi:hypothetical protein